MYSKLFMASVHNHALRLVGRVESKLKLPQKRGKRRRSRCQSLGQLEQGSWPAHPAGRFSRHVSLPLVIFLLSGLLCSALFCFYFILFCWCLFFSSLHALLFDFHKVLTTFASAVIAQNVLHVQRQHHQQRQQEINWKKEYEKLVQLSTYK